MATGWWARPTPPPNSNNNTRIVKRVAWSVGNLSSHLKVTSKDNKYTRIVPSRSSNKASRRQSTQSTTLPNSSSSQCPNTLKFKYKSNYWDGSNSWMLTHVRISSFLNLSNLYITCTISRDTLSLLLMPRSCLIQSYSMSCMRVRSASRQTLS